MFPIYLQQTVSKSILAEIVMLYSIMGCLSPDVSCLSHDSDLFKSSDSQLHIGDWVSWRILIGCVCVQVPTQEEDVEESRDGVSGLPCL